LYKLIEFTNESEYIDLFLSLPATNERKSEVTAWLDEKHIFTSFLIQRNLLVLRDNAPVARGIAFVNKEGNFGSIGFFECLNDTKGVKLLVDSAKEFCKMYKIKTIYAPMNGSIWSSYRLMTKGCEDKPFLGEPYNKPYYKEVLKKCGFEVAKTWQTQFVKKVSAKGQATDKYISEEKKQKSKGIKVKSITDFDQAVQIIHRLSMNSFAKNFLFHEIDEQTFAALYEDIKPIHDKRTIKIAYNAENEPVGWGFAFPDYQSKLGFLLKYAKRYIILYFGTLQKDGESLYPGCGKAIVVSILRNLYFRRKGYIRALMSEDSKTVNFGKDHKDTHEYALMKLEVE